MSEFDRHAATYASAVNDSIAFSGLKVDTFVRAKLFHLRRIFKQNGILQSDRVVDIGCGVGTYEMSLVEDWPNITGIDLSQESIVLARQNCAGASFNSFDGKHMPFESGAVAAAFTICVWHHVPIEDWSLFLKEIFRILRPGGILAVFEHNPWNPLTRRAVERCVFDKDAVLLSMRRAKKQMSAAGFSIQRSEYILSVPATTGIAGQIDRWLGSVPTGAQYLVVGRKSKN
jgi:ubiquinone/menaquinone biosynthesis C-methylase UbiE